MVIRKSPRRKPAKGEPRTSPITSKEDAVMAPRDIKEVTPKESNEFGTNKSELALPISVGNPIAADSFAIDQSHMEEFATAEEKSSDIRFGRPPKGIYFTARVETVKPWKDRAFYFLLEIEG